MEAAHVERSGSDDAEELGTLHWQKGAGERLPGAVNVGARPVMIRNGIGGTAPSRYMQEEKLHTGTYVDKLLKHDNNR